MCGQTKGLPPVSGSRSGSGRFCAHAVFFPSTRCGVQTVVDSAAAPSTDSAVARRKVQVPSTGYGVYRTPVDEANTRSCNRLSCVPISCWMKKASWCRSSSSSSSRLSSSRLSSRRSSNSSSSGSSSSRSSRSSWTNYLISSTSSSSSTSSISRFSCCLKESASSLKRLWGVSNSGWIQNTSWC